MKEIPVFLLDYQHLPMSVLSQVKLRFQAVSRGYWIGKEFHKAEGVDTGGRGSWKNCLPDKIAKKEIVKIIRKVLTEEKKDLDKKIIQAQKEAKEKIMEAQKEAKEKIMQAQKEEKEKIMQAQKEEEVEKTKFEKQIQAMQMQLKQLQMKKENE